LSGLWIFLLPSDVSLSRNAFASNYCPTISEGISIAGSHFSAFYFDVYPFLNIALRFFTLNVFHCMDILFWWFWHFKTTFVVCVPKNFPFGLPFVIDLPFLSIVTLFRSVFSFNDGLRWMHCHLFITYVLMVINSFLRFPWTPIPIPNHYRYTCVLTSFDSEILIMKTTFLLTRR